MLPGQFAELRVDNSPNTFLRRPISINYFDKINNQVWMLIQAVGDGTKKLVSLSKGEFVNVMLPLGNTFSLPESIDNNILLIGGGVGTAPMLFLGSHLKELGYKVNFLLGARTKSDLLQLEIFESIGNLYITTEDNSMGEKGYVTSHSILNDEKFDNIYTCGPKPMMVSVAKYAKDKNVTCEVSLENTMACGIGICLCCVEKTIDGHICVCSEGPVMNINKLKWQI